jgi:poly-gamma-glutamate capsule biosynthesis protein CapA/YwtB (metallophosphatase superfamily)
MRHRLPRVVLAGSCASLAACTIGPRPPAERAAVDVVLTVVDEGGAPLAGAVVAIGDDERTTSTSGTVRLDVNQAVVAIVSADEHLSEPVAIAPRDGEVTVRLWRRIDESGVPRAALHFGGDVMLGRRYLDTGDADRSALVTDAASARAAVAELASLTAVADLTTANLETVVGTLPLADAYPGKRFLIQSPPLVVDALEELGVDLVTLGNNHAYDWRDPGLRSTIAALDAASLPHVGGGLTRAEAVRGRIVDAGPLRVGVISFTTVNGDFVNDQLPGDDEQAPADVAPDQAWQYEQRSFGFGREGDPLYIARADRRAGSVWLLYEAIEEEIDDDAAMAPLWSALTAAGAYPELQDWVARRGHGGAAPYSVEEMRASIDALRADGVDQVIVQVHGGFQFGEVKSEGARNVAHRAIDAGADMVINHHPHVLQGLEWYRGKLIAYSLGNLVFDQDFLATFPTAVLRVVIAGDQLLEARALPVMIDRYRPVPAAGDTAQRIVRILDARSALRAETQRVASQTVSQVLEADPEGVEQATVTFERGSGIVGRGRRVATTTITAAPGTPAVLPSCALVRVDELAPGVEFGIDLVDWGRFNDDLDDGAVTSTFPWVLPPSPDRWTIRRGASGDDFDDAVELISDANDEVTLRMIARITTKTNRLLDLDRQPLDGAARFSIELDVLRERGEVPQARLGVDNFVDTDPTVEPVSTRLREVIVPLDVPADGAWHSLSIDLPPETFAAEDGKGANAALLAFDVPPAFRARVALDNVEIVEWREGALFPDGIWMEADRIRAPEAGTFDVQVSGCG